MCNVLGEKESGSLREAPPITGDDPDGGEGLRGGGEGAGGGLEAEEVEQGRGE